jgi:hypothetical protein
MRRSRIPRLKIHRDAHITRCIHLYVCMCVYMYIYIYIYIVCVYVCICIYMDKETKPAKTEASSDAQKQDSAAENS